MTRLNEAHPIGRACNRADESVDAITGVAVEASYTPVMQALDDEVTDCLRHTHVRGAIGVPLRT